MWLEAEKARNFNAVVWVLGEVNGYVSVGSCAYQVSVLSGVGLCRSMMVSEVPASECQVRGSCDPKITAATMLPRSPSPRLGKSGSTLRACLTTQYYERLWHRHAGRGGNERVRRRLQHSWRAVRGCGSGGGSGSCQCRR